MADVLFREQETASGHRLGIAILDAEKSLNSLTLEMIRLIDQQLDRWAVDPSMACVVLLGTGNKAFCAGGDVRSLRDAILAHRDRSTPSPHALTFFGEEYRLDYRIHTYAKPVLVWGNGIVMGGGLGLLAGASHRIVTETSRIAMPEISIGLFPDVGGSWFLSRMPGRTGLFLALTGAALNGHDALVVGLADFFVRSTDFDALMQRLATMNWTTHPVTNHAVLSSTLREFATLAVEARPKSNVRAHADAIEDLTDADTLAAVVRRITDYPGDDAWLKRAATTLAAGSPTTAALVWELRQRAKHLSLAQVFQLELIVAMQCAMHPDLPEGVRALLIDKDYKPRWTPPTIETITDEWIAEHFSPPWGKAPHPLADLSGEPHVADV
jgi:enoyl-CoA hydratase/carnithine racemase